MPHITSTLYFFSQDELQLDISTFFADIFFARDASCCADLLNLSSLYDWWSYFMSFTWQKYLSYLDPAYYVIWGHLFVASWW